MADTDYRPIIGKPLILSLGQLFQLKSNDHKMHNSNDNKQTITNKLVSRINWCKQGRDQTFAPFCLATLHYVFLYYQEHQLCFPPETANFLTCIDKDQSRSAGSITVGHVGCSLEMQILTPNSRLWGRAPV